MFRARIILVLLLMPALLSADAARDYKDALKRWKKTDKKFWQEFKTGWKNAYLTLRDPLEKAQAKPNQNKDAVRDYSAIEALYKSYEEAETERGTAAAAYASSGEAKALETLFKEVLNLGKAIDKLEKDLDGGKPNRGRYIFDQSAGVKRHALGVRQTMLPQSIAQAAGAAAFLAGDGWAQATKKDGKHSIIRRVCVLDAIAALPTDQRAAAKARLIETLRAPQSSLRVAAVDALGVWESDGVEPLLEALSDQNPIVRRATLELARDARFIKPLLDGLAAAEGLERTEQLAALHRLTKQKFGFDVPAWKEWYEAYADEIEAGKFDVESVEEQEVEKTTEFEAISFFGVKTMSHRIGFALEASFMLEIPAEVEFQRTRYVYEWYGSNPSWRKSHPNHQMALLDHLQQTLGGWPTEASFTLSLLHQNFQVTSFGEKRPLGAKARDIKEVLKKIEKLRGSGWCSQYEGIKEVMRIGRMPKGAIDFPNPHTDTIFLWSVGAPRGGRFMWIQAAADAIARLNRFRRVRIHTLRIGYEQETGGALMEAIAKRSGGTYVWLKAPPQ